MSNLREYLLVSCAHTQGMKLGFTNKPLFTSCTTLTVTLDMTFLSLAYVYVKSLGGASKKNTVVVKTENCLYIYGAYILPYLCAMQYFHMYTTLTSESERKQYNLDYTLTRKHRKQGDRDQHAAERV